MTEILSAQTLQNILQNCKTASATFHGLMEEELHWLDGIERCARELGVPENQWSNVALYFLRDAMKTVMEERKNHLVLFGLTEWDWEDFKQDYQSFYRKASKLLTPGVTFETPIPWEGPPIFPQLPEQAYVQEWLEQIEAGCNARSVPESRRADVATHFLTDELRSVMNERKQHLTLFGLTQWFWEDFKLELLIVCEDACMSLRADKLNTILDSWTPPPIFNGIPRVESISSWLEDLEKACTDHHIPPKQWTDAAIYFLRGDLKAVMEERKKEIATLGSSEWAWAKFKREFSSFCGIFSRKLDALIDPPVFNGLIDENATQWTDTVANFCGANQIPDSRLTDVAIYFLRGDLRTTFMKRKTELMQAGTSEWSWEEFKGEFFRIYEQTRQKLFQGVLHSWADPPIFGLGVGDHVPWLHEIEHGCQQRNVPPSLWIDTAIYFLRGDIRAVMEGRKAAIAESEKPEWTWEDFQLEFARTSQAMTRKREESAKNTSELKLVSAHPDQPVEPGALVSAAAGLSALTTGDALPAAVFAVINMTSWFRRSKSRR